MYNKYYQDELTFLREEGAEFARAYPQVAHMLAEAGTDPDVERLLEGFAFLTARIRQRLDSELSELTNTMIGLLWPHYLRPLPAMTIMQFDGKAHALSDTKVVPRGTMIDSVPVEDTRCSFRTCYDTVLYPFELRGVELEVPLSKPAQLKLQFAVTGGADLSQLELSSLRLYLAGEPHISYALYRLLCREVRSVVFRAVHPDKVGREQTHPADIVTPVGFDDREALLPYPGSSFTGYRLLQEYFSLPEKFLFVDIGNLDSLGRLEIGETFEIVFEFAHAPKDTLRLKKDHIQLYCTPAVNLFATETVPLKIEHNKTEYLLRPQGKERSHYEIFSIDSVVGWEQGSADRREFEPFYSFRHELSDRTQGNDYYQIEVRPATVGRGTDTYISFVTGEQKLTSPAIQTIAIDITATNRDLPEQLHVGEIRVSTSDSPSFADFKNISPVLPSVPPPLMGGVFWRLISHLSLNYLSLVSVENLRGILELYNFRALHDRQAERAHQLRLAGLRKVTATPDSHLIRGSMMRGLAIDLELDEDSFAGDGDLYLFASILNVFFNLYVTINSYTRLTVKGIRTGEELSWPPLLGMQPIL